MNKKKILIVSFDLEVGGIERSLIGLLQNFDYTKYDVDLMLYSHTGEFMAFLPDNGYRLLPENSKYATFRRGIAETAKKHPYLAFKRILAKRAASNMVKKNGGVPQGKEAAGYCTIQQYWDYSIKNLPALQGEYDAAISFMWPHHFVSKKVNAKKKFAWIHTDYTKAFYDRDADERIWASFDRIVAVSEDCRKSFCEVFPLLTDKTTVVENILSQELVRKQADENIDTGDMTVSEGELSILSVGRFAYAKAFENVPEIVRIMLDDGYKLKWFIIGYGKTEQLVRDRIKELDVEDSVVILGKKLNVYPYMKKADIYAQPSRYEGKAVTVREAQMLGRPVIITNFKTAQSQVEANVDAVICPLEISETAKAIEKLIDDTSLRDRLRETAYSRNYGNTDEVNKIYDLIEGK